MKIGAKLMAARKRCGFSQETVAERLAVSRQTISKWELDETIPDLIQAKRLAEFYQIDLATLFEEEIDLEKIEEMIQNSNEKKERNVNWTKAWSKKYSVLKTYQEEVEISFYATKIRVLLESLKQNYHYQEKDAMLVLKDILYHEWKDQ